VANLLLARATARQKEIGLRIALGAGRARIVRQLLTESLLLAAISGAAGLAIGVWVLELFIRFGSGELLRWQTVRINGLAVLFAIAAALVTSLVFGLAPALSASQLRPARRSRSSNRLRNLLVVSEVALALLLMIGASLMVRSLLNLQDVNPGFNPAGVLTASVNLPASKYSKPDQQTAFYRRLQERLEAMPGVAAAGMTSVLPLIGSNQGTALFIQGRPVSSPSDLPILWFRIVNTKYFQAMQIPLRKGRLFTEQDAPGAPRALIVNETMARRYWPNEDPIGKQVGNGRPDGWVPVVGVVGDVRHMSLAQEPDAEIYYPFAQSPQPAMSLALRTSSDPLRFAPALRQAVLEIDREQPVSRVASMEQTLAGSLAAKRFSTVLLGIFAVVALVLATIGIYGVISFSVTRRTHEIGIRMALGARGADVLRMVVLRGTLLALLGVFVGLAAAFALTRVIGSLLYGVRATDTLIFSAVSLLLIAVAALASYLPARRAARVDPMVALRYE